MKITAKCGKCGYIQRIKLENHKSLSWDCTQCGYDNSFLRALLPEDATEENKYKDADSQGIELIKIWTISETFEFKGKYRRDLEKPNWHYYETEEGKLFHFRKEHIIAVCSG